MLREILASFTIEVDKEGNLLRGNASVDALKAKLEGIGAIGAKFGGAAAGGVGKLTSYIGRFFTSAVHDAEHAVHGLHDAMHSLVRELPAPLQHLAHMLAGPLGVAGAAAFAVYELSHLAIEEAEAAKAVDAHARMLGMSSDAYQVLGAFAKEAGTSVESVGVAVRTLSNAVINPTNETAQAFQRIGLRVEELKGLSPDEVFYKVGGAIGELTDEQTRQAVTAKLMGRGGQALIPIFDGGAEAIAHHRHELEELAVVYDKDFIKKSKGLTKALEDFGLGWARLKKTFLEPLLEPLTTIFEFMGHALQATVKFAKQLSFPRIALVAMLPVIQALAASALPRLLLGFAIMAGRAAVSFALMVAPLLILEDLITFLTGGDSETGAIMNALFGDGTADQVQAIVIEMTAAFNQLWDAMLGKGRGPQLTKLIDDFKEALGYALELTPGDVKANRIVAGMDPLTGGSLPSGKSDFELANQYGIDEEKITNARRRNGIPVPSALVGGGVAGGASNSVQVGDTTVIVNGVNPNNSAAVSSAVSGTLSRGRDAIIAPYIGAGVEGAI